MANPLNTLRSGVAICAVIVLAGCSGGFDGDLRSIGDGFDTSDATRQVAGSRPVPDSRGVISYPTYQVALARRGDTVGDVAARVGVSPAELAAFNGLRENVSLREGEILALPSRVDPDIVPGAISTETLGGAGTVDVATVAGGALDGNVGATSTASAPTAEEPVRHQVAPGETAFSIARLYGVTPRALAEWNNLGPDFAVRAGQYLLIPTTAQTEGTRVAAVPSPTQTDAAPVSQPGEGSAVSAPPSAATALPQEDATPEPAEAPPSPEMASAATEVSDTGRFVMPVTGSIIRAYEPGSNEGIGIAAPAGSAVRAADAGTVAAITRDADQVPILVLRHTDNILTVYAGVDGVAVEKGDTVGRGDQIAVVRDTSPSFVHFEVRDGFESVDPMPYLN